MIVTFHSFTDSQYYSMATAFSQALIIASVCLYALYIYYGEKNYEYLNAKWMYKRGDINFCNGKNIPVLLIVI